MVCSEKTLDAIWISDRKHIDFRFIIMDKFLLLTIYNIEKSMIVYVHNIYDQIYLIDGCDISCAYPNYQFILASSCKTNFFLLMQDVVTQIILRQKVKCNTVWKIDTYHYKFAKSFNFSYKMDGYWMNNSVWHWPYLTSVVKNWSPRIYIYLGLDFNSQNETQKSSDSIARCVTSLSSYRMYSTLLLQY